jgi:hypothetical protein
MVLRERSVHAGTYAHDRYRRGLRVWRSRTRLIVAVCFGPFIAAGLVGLIIEGHLLAWAAGVAFGAGTGAVVAIRESPPSYIENWQLGAQGERKTETALKSLEPPQWAVVHDVGCARGNYDHIVVGRAGVFLLETKSLQGIVHIRDGQPYLRRRSDPEADKACSWIRADALAGAATLKEDIQRRTGRRLWVQAVVVLWSDFEEGVYEDERCMLVHGPRLHDWILRRPELLDQGTTDELAEGIRGIAAAAR